MELTQLLSILILILSIVAHEVSHGYAALLFGDPTAKIAGRLTPNPLKHLDFIGSIVVPSIFLLTSGGIAGWAKPVPYNPINLRDRKWGEIFIAAAGPLSNLLLVIVFLVLAKVIFRTSLVNSLGDLADPIGTMLGVGMSLNIILAVFNMIPVPPLDGSKVLMNLLPDSVAESYAQVPDWAGFIVLFLLIRIGFTDSLTRPIEQFVMTLLNL